MEHLKRDPKKTSWVIKRKGYLEEKENTEIREANSEKIVEKAETEEKKEKPAKK